MAGKYSIYKYVKLAGKGWRYARAAYHPNGKIKPDAVLVKGVNGKNVEEKHPEGSSVPVARILPLRMARASANDGTSFVAILTL
jgi:hypothetical protein